MTARHVFLTTDAVGGVWRYSLALAEGFASRGWTCTIASMGPSPNAVQRQEITAIAGATLLDTGLPLDWTAPDAGTLSVAIDALIGHAKGADADSAHVHTPALAAIAWPLPVVAAAHSCVGTWWHAVHGTQPPADFEWRMAMVGAGLRNASTVIAPSAALAGDLRGVYGSDIGIRVVNNGLPPPPQMASHGRSGVLAAGRLWDAGKNIALLDRAAAMTGALVSAAGPLHGPDGAGFTPRHLHHLGDLPAPALHAKMAEAAVFAAPSLYEPFGLAVLEAAQRGTPLLLADIPTFRELWDGAATFADPHDANAWADALRTLLAPATLREALGKRAAARARGYTADRMVQSTAAIHEAVMLETV